MVMPISVPVLNARDFVRGKLDSADGCRHCLIGWASVVAPSCPRVILRAIEEQIFTTHIAAFNDSRRNSKKEIAEVWNNAMRRLGYTEIMEVAE